MKNQKNNFEFLFISAFFLIFFKFFNAYEILSP